MEKATLVLLVAFAAVSLAVAASTNIPYDEVVVGTCTTVSMSQCEEIARTRSVSFIELNGQDRPLGCSMYHDGSQFFFDTASSSNQHCSDYYRCICKPRTSLRGDCLTTKGSQVGKPCVFPFKYEGATCTGGACCNLDNDTQGNWCATEVDASRNMLNWGYCQNTPCEPLQYITKTSGKCTTGFNKQECERIARNQGFGIYEEANGDYPPGCYRYKNKVLFFNTRRSDYSCSSDYPCYCKA